MTPESRTLNDIDQLLRNVPGARSEWLTLGALIEREAETLLAAYQAGHPATAYLVRGDKYRPGQSAATDAEVLAAGLTLEQGRACMVRWHWFADWAEVLPQAQQLVDPQFEAACDAIVSGDAGALRRLISRQPALVRARSRFAHHQTLLQHVAANGIENSRQWQSPRNAVELAEILLAAGAEPDVPCDSYGGGTAMTLLVSSAHPAAAGVQGDLVEVLCKAGAKPDGPDDDGAPLWTAISFGYRAAVERLVGCGARVDNLLFAAAVGDLAAVQSYFDPAGRLVPERAHQWGRAQAITRGRRPDKTLHARHMLEYALHWAAMHRRLPVVELLLTKAPDLSVKEPTWNNTVLDSAQYGGDPAIVALIKPRFDTAQAPR